MNYDQDCRTKILRQMKCERQSFDIINRGTYPKNLCHVLPQNKFMYSTILYYVLNTKWRIVSQTNHCTTTRKRYYTTNKLPPITVSDRKIIPNKLLAIFCKKTPHKKFNEICKERINN